MSLLYPKHFRLLGQEAHLVVHERAEDVSREAAGVAHDEHHGLEVAQLLLRLQAGAFDHQRVGGHVSQDEPHRREEALHIRGRRKRREVRRGGRGKEGRHLRRRGLDVVRGLGTKGVT